MAYMPTGRLVIAVQLFVHDTFVPSAKVEVDRPLVLNDPISPPSGTTIVMPPDTMLVPLKLKVSAAGAGVASTGKPNATAAAIVNLKVFNGVS